MYNRYVRNNSGVYRRVPVQPPQTHKKDPDCGRAPHHSPPPPGNLTGKDGLLSGILGKLNLEDIDSGDLLLLVLLFLLFRDGEDDELLIALGLLLIL